MVTNLVGLALSLSMGTGGQNWPIVTGDSEGTCFSRLSQINATNVKGLQEAWVFHTKENSGNTPIQCTPIVVEGTMYLVTAGHQVVALDPPNS